MTRNPFDDDPSFDWVRIKWGQPDALEVRDSDTRYRCRICEASWVGPTGGDWCDWCHERWVTDQHANRQRVLFPEFIGWGHRFFALKPIDQAVWAQNRGLTGDYQSAWLVRLQQAYTSTHINRDEFVAALERYKQWKLTQPSKPLSESFGT